MIRVLVPLDGSQLAEQAISHAAAVARSFKTEIHLLQVIADATASEAVLKSADVRMQVAGARSYLGRLAESECLHGSTVCCAVTEGSPAQQIVAYAQAEHIDLIAVTAFGRGGVTEFVHGSTVHKVISTAGVSILLVRPDPHARLPTVRYRKLLVPLDGSYRTDWALCLATSIARAHGAELMLMQVVQSPKASRNLPASRTERELLERLVEIQKSDAAHHLRELERRLPDDVVFSSQVIVAEEASRVIEALARSEDVGLLVLSAHGLNDVDCWLYGPVSETLLAHSTRPLLVLQDNLSSDKVEFEPCTEPIALNK